MDGGSSRQPTRSASLHVRSSGQGARPTLKAPCASTSSKTQISTTGSCIPDALPPESMPACTCILLDIWNGYPNEQRRRHSSDIPVDTSIQQRLARAPCQYGMNACSAGHLGCHESHIGRWHRRLSLSEPSHRAPACPQPVRGAVRRHKPAPDRGLKAVLSAILVRDACQRDRIISQKPSDCEVTIICYRATTTLGGQCNANKMAQAHMTHCGLTAQPCRRRRQSLSRTGGRRSTSWSRHRRTWR